jgi:hypothetical protein
MPTNKKKRRNKNEKAPPTPSTTSTSTLDELVKGMTLTSASASSSSEMTCYHGSTADKFSLDSDYRKVICNYLSTLWKLKKDERIEYQRKFGNDHVELVKDPRFGQFVFAFSTTMYLNTYLNSNLKSSYAFNAVQQLLQLGISIKFACTSSIRLSVVEGCDKDIGFKHIRDINDERGVINCLSRETKNFCDCMKPKKIEAKNMEKLGQCHGCKEWFQKADLLFCTGCNAVKYCSKECQRQKWNDHKVDCKRIRET